MRWFGSESERRQRAIDRRKPLTDRNGRLLWRDIDLANARIQIGRSKTQAGLRTIEMLPMLRDELAAHKTRSWRTGPDDPVFPTGTGGRRDKDNLRNRILERIRPPL